MEFAKMLLMFSSALEQACSRPGPVKYWATGVLGAALGRTERRLKRLPAP